MRGDIKLSREERKEAWRREGLDGRLSHKDASLASDQINIHPYGSVTKGLSMQVAEGGVLALVSLLPLFLPFGFDVLSGSCVIKAPV